MGGGLFCGTTNNLELAGVLSFGFACGGVNAPGVFVEVRQYNEWIQLQFVRQQRFTPGTLVGNTGGVV